MPFPTQSPKTLPNWSPGASGSWQSPPWFLLLTVFVGLNQWLFVGAGWCRASLLLERGAGIEKGCRR